MPGGVHLRPVPAADFAHDLADGLRRRLAASQGISPPTVAAPSRGEDGPPAPSVTVTIDDADSGVGVQAPLTDLPARSPRRYRSGTDAPGDIAAAER